MKPILPRRVSRAQFLKIGAGLVGGSLGAYVLYELAPWLDGTTPATNIRRPLQPGLPGTPPMRELIRYATLAASGHNAQPWKFSIEDRLIRIQPDNARRLPAVDPEDRELWMSLGCALENLTIAAAAAGYEADITYPEENDHVSVRLTPIGARVGPLFDAIPNRQNTRSEYDGRTVSVSDINQLLSIPGENGIRLHLFEGHSKTEQLLEFVSLGDATQFADKAFMEELIQWVRFDKREALATMDGLSSLCMGSPQVPRWIGQRFLASMSPQKQADSDANKLRSSAGAIAISSETEDKPSWVRTGQVYQRLGLKLTSMNIKSAFLNQPNEVPTVRSQFRTACGFGAALPQLLLRFGYANPMPSSYRRSVDQVMI